MRSTAFKSGINAILGRAGLELRRRNAAPNVAIEASERDGVIISRCQPYTMTSRERLWALINAVHYVNRNDLPGDLVECGVWRGGSAMAMALTEQLHYQSRRQLWLYDTFEGMTSPSDYDVELHTGRSARDLLRSTSKSTASNVWAFASLQDVQQNMASTEFPSDRIRYCVGDVAETLLTNLPNEVSILRLDTDWYESTRIELDVLEPRVIRGGVVIIDDYGHWAGARKAVDDFLADLKFKPLVNRIDYSGRLWIKP